MIKKRNTGFTLIELLVVVAIIALLISILLPALARAKEQARIAKCLANLRGLAQAGNSYMLEFSDLPWAIRTPANNDNRYGFGCYSEFIYGGAMPNQTLSEWQNAGLAGLGPDTCDVYRVPPRFRPLNIFLAPSVSWDAEPASPPASRRQAPAETPDNFVCPSDFTAAVPTVGRANPTPEPDTVFRCWDFWGTSYPINWYWPYYYQFATGGSFGSGTFLDHLGVTNAPGSGPRLLRNVGGKLASQFIIFYENQFNFAIEGAKPPTYSGRPWSGANRRKLVKGWHQQFSFHVASFLDGHAEHRKYDTRFVFGDGWSIWPNKPWEGRWAAYNSFAPTDANAN